MTQRSDLELLAYRVARVAPLLTNDLEVDGAGSIEERYGIRSYDNLDEALAQSPQIVFVCNPTRYYMTVALAAALLLTPTSRAADVGYAEDFALARDRAAVLGQLIPGTEDYYFYHALHALQTEQYDQAVALTKPWLERFGQTQRLTEVQIRPALLTYDRDRETLAQALEDPRPTRTLVVLRHAKARSRTRWRADDRFRPLLALGAAQAERLVPVLGAYDVTRLVTSSSTRCVATVLPYAEVTGRHVESDDRLSEEDATAGDVADVATDLVARGKRTAVCMHRPVLPQLWHALGCPDRKLEPAEMVVLHHRDGTVLAVELHDQ